MEFEDLFFHGKTVPGTIVTVKREKTKNNKDRIVGATIFTNQKELNQNIRVIRSNKIERDESSLRNADVPEYDFLAKRFNRKVNDKWVYLWHITHLIPFRHTLSEGNDIKNIIFAGTAQLNAGHRPQIDYKMENTEGIDSRDSRKEILLKEFTCNVPLESYGKVQASYQKGESIFDKYYKAIHSNKDINVQGAPKGTTYSLSEVEEAVDIIIRSNPTDLFAYGNILDYKNETDLSPKWITSVLINKTKGSIVFQIRLTNDL